MTYRVMAIHDMHSSPAGDLFRVDENGDMDIQLLNGDWISSKAIGIPNFAYLQTYVQATAGARIVDVEVEENA